MKIRISTTQYVGELSREVTMEIEEAGQEEVATVCRVFQEQAPPAANAVITPSVTINVCNPIDGEAVVEKVKEALVQATEEANERLQKLARGPE